MTVRWLPKSITDFTEHVDFLAEGSSDVANRFIDAVVLTCGILSTSPMIGGKIVAMRPEHNEIRVWPVRSFRRYLVFYRAVEDAIEIVRIIHGAQDWQDLEI